MYATRAEERLADYAGPAAEVRPLYYYYIKTIIGQLTDALDRSID